MCLIAINVAIFYIEKTSYDSSEDDINKNGGWIYECHGRYMKFLLFT